MLSNNFGKFAKILIILLICGLIFAACVGGDDDPPNQPPYQPPTEGTGEGGEKEPEADPLVLSGLGYNDTTKVFSWDKVAGAVGYALRIGASEKDSALITESGGRMQFVVAEPTSGTLTVYVKALGNGETSLDSEEQSLQINYTAKLPTPANAAVFLATLTWDMVPNATGYSVQINGNTPIEVGNVTEYWLLPLIKPMTYSIKVQATGAGTGFDNSDFSQAVGYTVQPQNVSIGALHSLAIDADGNLWASGWNTSGQLGDGTTTNSNVFIPVMAGNKFVKAVAGSFQAAGSSQSFAIDQHGGLWTWGGNIWPGDGSTSSSHTPAQIMPDTRFVAAAAGENFSLAVDEHGNLWSWGGNNASGQLGIGSTATSATPIQVMAGTKFIALSTSRHTAMGLDSEGNLWVWGSVPSFPFTDTMYGNILTPIRIFEGIKLSAIPLALFSTVYCAIDTDGNLLWWDESTTADNPKQIKQGTKFVAISAETRFKSHFMAIDTEGNLWSWGQSQSVGLGDGITTQSDTPIQVMPGTKFALVSVGEYVFAVDAAGNLWGWGENWGGLLGDGRPYQYIAHGHLPAQVGDKKYNL
jgi:alpha-tubulin suppressor-like RCC1 family protein